MTVASSVELLTSVTVHVVDEPLTTGFGAQVLSTATGPCLRTTVTGNVVFVLPFQNVTVAKRVSPSGMSRPSTVMLSVFEAPGLSEKTGEDTHTRRPLSDFTVTP